MVTKAAAAVGIIALEPSTEDFIYSVWLRTMMRLRVRVRGGPQEEKYDVVGRHKDNTLSIGIRRNYGRAPTC